MTTRARKWTRCMLCAASLLSGCTAESGTDTDDTASPWALALVQAPKIERVSMRGSGCDDARASAIGIAGDRSSFRIRFDDFTVNAEDAAGATSECVVSVVLDAPDGVAYAPAGLTLSTLSSTMATLASEAFWANAPSAAAGTITDLTARRGLRTSKALDAPSLFSSCSGERALQIALKLTSSGVSGKASLEQLSNLTFHAVSCDDAGLPLDADVEVPDSGARDAGTPMEDAGPVDTGTPMLDTGTPMEDAGTVDAGGPPEDAGASDATTTPDAPEGSVGEVVVNSAVVTGSGCPAGSTSVRLADAKDSFEIDFSRFIAEVRPPLPFNSQGCIANVQVAIPPGKSVALDRLRLRGTASLSANATARVTAYYNFQGGDGQSSVSRTTTFKGPFSGPIDAAIAFGDNGRLFSNCARTTSAFTIRLNLAADGGEGGSEARASIEQLTGARFVVRDCP